MDDIKYNEFFLDSIGELVEKYKKEKNPEMAAVCVVNAVKIYLEQIKDSDVLQEAQLKDLKKVLHICHSL